MLVLELDWYISNASVSFVGLNQTGSVWAWDCANHSLFTGQDEHFTEQVSYQEEEIKEIHWESGTSMSVTWGSFESTAKDFIASKMER